LVGGRAVLSASAYLPRISRNPRSTARYAHWHCLVCCASEHRYRSGWRPSAPHPP
jgi:hypothetical protein